MAQLRNTYVFTFRYDVTKGALVTVGHNRQVRTQWQTDEKAGKQLRYVECFLHGHNVATFCVEAYWFAAAGAWDLDPMAVSVVLNDCGYRTATTRNAMKDFLDAMRLAASVSFVGGRLKARYMALNASWYEDEETGPIKTFNCVRHVGKL